MKLSLENRHIIVTGGTGHLGSAVVDMLVSEGSRCSIPCFDDSELDDFGRAEDENVNVETGVDLTNEDVTRTFFKKSVEKQGELWGSVHLAGGFGMGAIENTPLADFNRQLQLNTVTCYNACRSAIHWMRKTGQGGRIVNVAARPALEPRSGKGMTAYTVAKSGVASLTQSLAAEVVEEDILINAIAPSIIDTPPNRQSMSKADYRKWPKPAQLASQIASLISPENEITRGAVIPVYGQS